MSQLFKTAALTVDYVEESRRLEASGALSLMVRPVLNKINERLTEEKPALLRENDLISSTWLPPIPSGPFRRLVLNEARMAIGRYVPQTVSIEVTRECGCECDHCTVKDGSGDLSREDFFRVIDEAIALGACIITFTEGDPLLREDIFELIKYVDPDKAVVNLFTPGLEMTEDKAIKLKEAGLYNLLISIYSIDPEVHDAIRGVKGAHELAISAIKEGLQAGLLVTMTTHVTPERVDQLPELYRLAEGLGVHEFSIWEAIPRRPDECLTQIDREKILRFYRTMNSDNGGPRVFSSTYFEGQMMGCMAGRRWLHVAVDGSVRACPYLGSEYGNVMEDSLEEIWKKVRSSGEFDGFDCGCPAQTIISDA